MPDLEEINQLRADLAEAEIELSKIRPLAQWILEAQERNSDPEKRLQKYLETAEEARNLLNEDAFNTAFADLITDIQNQILNTGPDQTADRENYYLESQALQRILLKLNYQITIATERKLKAAS